MAKAIIFDIDGTLIDSVDYHAKAWQETFERYGVSVTFEQVRGQIGKGGDQLMPVFLPPKMLKEQGEQISKDRGEHFKAKYLPLVRPFPQVRELFERLKAAGKTVVLASSGKQDEVDEYKKLAGIEDLVQSDTSADDAERSKPHPDIFLAALENCRGVSKADVVAVGDTPYDAEAAGKAGLRTVGVLCGGFPAVELTRAGCFALYRDPAHLLAEFDSSPLA